MVRFREHRVIWVMRLSVTALVLTIPLLNSQLDAFHSETRLVTVIALWSIWAGSLLSVLVPSSGSLTALRLLMPSHTAVTAIVISGSPSGMSLWPAIIAVAISLIATVTTLSGDTGRYYVQVSAYGDERRFLLSCPPQMVVVQVLTWMLWFVAAVITVSALTGESTTSGQMIVGGMSGIVTVVGIIILPRRFHRFSRRWLVWVPAGIVLHDPVVLAETAMVSRRTLREIKIWQPGEKPEPLNVTGGRARPGIMFSLREMETIILSANAEHPGGHALHVQSFLVRPTRLMPALVEMNQRLSER